MKKILWVLVLILFNNAMWVYFYKSEKDELVDDQYAMANSILAHTGTHTYFVKDKRGYFHYYRTPPGYKAKWIFSDGTQVYFRKVSDPSTYYIKTGVNQEFNYEIVPEDWPSKKAGQKKGTK